MSFDDSGFISTFSFLIPGMNPFSFPDFHFGVPGRQDSFHFHSEMNHFHFLNFIFCWKMISWKQKMTFLQATTIIIIARRSLPLPRRKFPFRFTTKSFCYVQSFIFIAAMNPLSFSDFHLGSPAGRTHFIFIAK